MAVLFAASPLWRRKTLKPLFFVLGPAVGVGLSFMIGVVLLVEVDRLSFVDKRTAEGAGHAVSVNLPLAGIDVDAGQEVH